jgi:integrase
MAKRIWDGEPNIDEKNGKFRIRIWQDNRFIVDEIIRDSDVTRKSDFARVKKLRDQYLAKINLGLPLKDESVVNDAVKGYTTFPNAIDDFLINGLKNPTDRTVSDYRKILENKWLPVFGNCRVNEITKSYLEKYFYEKVREGNKIKLVRDWQPKYRENLIGPLRGLLKHFDIEPNPCEGVLDTKSVASKNRKKFKPYQKLEVQKLLDRLEGDSKYYFQFAFATGMRHQEILPLMWPDIHNQTATVQRVISDYRIVDRVKTDYEGREVFLNSAALDAINKMQSRWQKGFIFPKPDGDYYKKKPKRFRAAWTKAHKQTGISYRPMRITRHTRATELLSKGVNPAKAAKQLGHDVETFLEKYAEYLPDYDPSDNSLLESNFS